ncbi:endonuclease/exonuclease/phosphatase family protein [Actinoplanes hulinensis]|uniref:Endonuclease/exonuclease/phosphatase family protein n=1 Tax=Actinoplanes hulinensis TaxID=1144547 RepID=A0ABS7B8H8_9ACTN|nr:endonuclease/exonuclease/phosphatase family protein [Actinoplanes hulinensis]MBW6437255.1 endonuclease/exonuclease/phosphatase family protein [Actinoplanes hulinensis]
MTLNTLFKGDVRPRLRVLGEILEESRYDVVCLQEVMYRHLIPRYPHRVSAGTVLLKGGLVVLSRWPVTRSRFVRFPLTAPARPEYLMRKGALVVTVDTDDGEVVVINTHLSANRDDDWSAENRYTGIARTELGVLARQVAAVGPAAPVVVTGDLNVPRDSVVLREFLNGTGLQDVLAGDTRPTYRPTPGWPNPPAFDHILVRPPMTGSAHLVFQDEVTLADGRRAHLSDHYGVEADLILSPAG